MKMLTMCAMRGRGGTSGTSDSWHNVLEIGSADYSNTITSVQKDNLLIYASIDNAQSAEELRQG